MIGFAAFCMFNTIFTTLANTALPRRVIVAAPA
jgi:hypothetical protein